LKVKREYGKIDLKWNWKKKNFPEPVFSYWRSYLHAKDIIQFLENNSLEGSLLHTEFSHSEFKCYGHPVKGIQDRVEVKIEDHILQVQCLILCQKSKSKQLKQCCTMWMNPGPMQWFIFWNTIFLENLTGDGNCMVIRKKSR